MGNSAVIVFLHYRVEQELAFRKHARNQWKEIQGVREKDRSILRHQEEVQNVGFGSFAGFYQDK